jgi:hypothetical protein
LLACRGTKVVVPMVTASAGLPLANSARPSVQRYASSEVHSALLVGFESAKMIGRSLAFAMARRTFSVNALGWAATPISAVGRSVSTAACSVAIGACAWANGRLCGCRSVRSATTNPLESRNQHRCRASASLSPSSRIAVTISSPMPVAAEPAP